jgi:hypothetical protein
MHGLGEGWQGTREPRYDRIVVLTIAAWMVAHLLLWAVLGLPDFFRCVNGATGPYRSGCGMALGLTSLLIGGVQLVYGLLVGLGIREWRRPIGEGILIATAVVALLHTVLCFGVAGR